jgi:hypothetical protein
MSPKIATAFGFGVITGALLGEVLRPHPLIPALSRRELTGGDLGSWQPSPWRGKVGMGGRGTMRGPSGRHTSPCQR